MRTTSQVVLVQKAKWNDGYNKKKQQQQRRSLLVLRCIGCYLFWICVICKSNNLT